MSKLSLYVVMFVVFALVYGYLGIHMDQLAHQLVNITTAQVQHIQQVSQGMGLGS